jgi:hypothetical protein
VLWAHVLCELAELPADARGCAFKQLDYERIAQLIPHSGALTVTAEDASLMKKTEVMRDVLLRRLQRLSDLLHRLRSGHEFVNQSHSDRLRQHAESPCD